MTTAAYTLDDATRDGQRIAAALRYFPRRDPHAVANVIACLAESCSTPTQAETAVQACEQLECYRSLAELQDTIRHAAADPQPAPPDAPAHVNPPPLHVCPTCPWTRDEAFTPAERLAAIERTRATCPACPYLPTALVLAQCEADEAAELERFYALPAAERAELEASAANILRHLKAQFPASTAYDEPNARRMIQLFSLTLHRRNTERSRPAASR